MQDSSRDSNSGMTFDIRCSIRNGPLQRWTFRIGLLAFVALAGRTLAAATVAGPNEPAETPVQQQLSQRLEELIGQLRQERSSYYTEKARYDGLIEKASANRRTLRGELEDLRQQESETARQIAGYQAEVEDLKQQLISKASIDDAIGTHVEPLVAKERKAIGQGIPYKQRERIVRLEAAAADANDPSITSAADRLGHLWSYGQEELRLAGSSETYTARANTAADSSPHARFFRVGQRILGYVTEDGKHAAMWLSMPQQEGWRSIAEAKQAAQVRSAVEILDRRQGPRLLTLPITLWPTSHDKENADVSP